MNISRSFHISTKITFKQTQNGSKSQYQQHTKNNQQNN